MKESYDELVHKVSWPTWKDLQSSAIVVLIASVIIALLIFLMDFVFGVRVVDETSNDFAWRGVLGFFYEMISKS